MRLYYFTSEKHGLAAIRDRRLKLARINELNDPFEFLIASGERKDRKVVRQWKDQLANNYGLLCMSHGWQHPLLWGHYADRHKGICLGFDVTDDDTFHPLEYRAARWTLAELGLRSLDDMDESALKKILFSKFDAWKYEEEYRCFARLESADQATGLFFIDLSTRFKLAQIILGARSELTRAAVKTAVGNSSNSVAIIKARAGFHRFEVVRDKSWKG